MSAEILRADRSSCNESKALGMAGCLAIDGTVVCFFPNEKALKSAPTFAIADDLLSVVKAATWLLLKYRPHDECEEIKKVLSAAHSAILKATP